jgi:hypothetical protein
MGWVSLPLRGGSTWAEFSWRRPRWSIGARVPSERSHRSSRRRLFALSAPGPAGLVHHLQTVQLSPVQSTHGGIGRDREWPTQCVFRSRLQWGGPSRLACTAAAFEGCLSANTKLDNVDFQTSTFVECRFEGDLHGVVFHRRGFKGEAYPPNEMRDIDFTRARLREVEFRG